MSVVEITSAKGLLQWLCDHANESEWYGRRAPCRAKCLLLSDKSSVTFEWDSCTSENLPLYSIQLPSKKEAREWWFRLWEEEIIEYYYSPVSAIVCIAKSGTWKSLSP